MLSVWVVGLLFVACFWVLFVCGVCLGGWLEFECVGGFGVGVWWFLFRWFKLLFVCMALIAAVCWFEWCEFVLMV